MRKFVVVKSEKIIDSKTGEVTYQDTIERKPQELIHVWNPHEKESRMKYIKTRCSLEAKKKRLTLTQQERAFLCITELYMDWETNILIGDGQTVGKKKQPLKWKDIDKIVGFDPRTRRKIVEGLIKKNILGFLTTDRKKGIVINPEYALNGKKPAKALINTFNSADPLEEEEEEEQK